MSSVVSRRTLSRPSVVGVVWRDLAPLLALSKGRGKKKIPYIYSVNAQGVISFFQVLFLYATFWGYDRTLKVTLTYVYDRLAWILPPTPPIFLFLVYLAKQKSSPALVHFFFRSHSNSLPLAPSLSPSYYAFLFFFLSQKFFYFYIHIFLR